MKKTILNLCLIFSSISLLKAQTTVPAGILHIVGVTATFDPQGYDVLDSAHLVFPPGNYNFNVGAAINLSSKGFLSTQDIGTTRLRCSSGFWDGIVVRGYTGSTGAPGVPSGFSSELAIYFPATTEIYDATSAVVFYDVTSSGNTKCRAINATTSSFINCKDNSIVYKNSSSSSNASYFNQCGFKSNHSTHIDFIYSERTYQVKIANSNIDCLSHQNGVHLVKGDIICTDNLFTNYKTGIWQEGSSAASGASSYIHSNQFNTTTSGAKALDSDNTLDLLFELNKVSGGDYGVHITEAEDARILDNTMSTSLFPLFSMDGIDNDFIGNIIQTTFIGLFVKNSDKAAITDNEITNAYFGIHVENSTENTLARNEVYGNSSTQAGIKLINTAGPVGTLVVKNKINNGNYLFHFAGDNSGAQICSNYLSGNTNRAIYVTGIGIPDQGGVLDGRNNDLTGIIMIGSLPAVIYNSSTNTSLDFYSTTPLMPTGAGYNYVNGQEIATSVSSTCGSGWKKGQEQELTNSQAEISFYPNPASNLVYLTSESTIQNVTVYDLKGSIILFKTSVNGSSLGQINIGKLEKGSYILKIKTNKEVIQKKLIKL